MVVAYLGFTLLAGFGSTLLALLVWRERRVPGSGFFALMAAGAAIWCAAAAFELLAPTPEGKVVAARLAYMGKVLIPWSWLLFALAYTGRGPRHLTRAALALALIPLTTVLLAFLSASQPLVWSAARQAGTAGPYPLLIERGSWFWVNIGFSYACMVVGSALLLQAVTRIGRVFTAQGIIIVLATTLPLLANALTTVGAVPLKGLDLTPPTIVASAALIALVTIRMQAMSVHPGIVSAAQHAILEDMRDGVLVLDSRGHAYSANRAAEVLLASAPSPLPGRHVESLLRCQSDDEVPCLSLTERISEPIHDAEVRSEDEGGPSLEIVVSRLGTASRVSGYVLVMRDVSERKRLQEDLRHSALHDELTGLPNRRLLKEQLEELLELAKRRGERLSLLMIDLDHFKMVNDTFGHEAGDELLRITAGRLLGARREGDVVVRLGGDEFAVVMPTCGERDALRHAKGLRAELMAPIEMHDQHLSVGAAVGVATSPAHGRSPGELLRHADVALYTAKEGLEGVAPYRATHDSNSPERLALLYDLRSAIESNDLELHYQPEIDLAGKHVVRLEALARWQRSSDEQVPPSEFIPLAEKHGLPPALTRWVLGTALRDCAALHQAGFDVAVAINLSALDLQDMSLPKRVALELERAGVSPQKLWIEVTETGVMRDPERSRRLLTELRALGVCVAIDDFGTGQSSLAYLHALPANDVKIDRSFILRLARESHDQAIVRAIVRLAHELGLTVTAEGVEDEMALKRLCHYGCDHAQGFFIAHPMPFEALLTWLGEHSTAMRDTRAVDAAPKAALRQRGPRTPVSELGQACQSLQTAHPSSLKVRPEGYLGRADTLAGGRQEIDHARPIRRGEDAFR